MGVKARVVWVCVCVHACDRACVFVCERTVVLGGVRVCVRACGRAWWWCVCVCVLMVGVWALGGALQL